MTLAIFDLLSLVDVSGGVVEHRIRIQKEAFLLQWLGSPMFRELHFTYHYFGPYSRELSDVLHQAVTSGLLKENVEQAETITRYSYELTNRGAELAKKYPAGASLGRIVKGLNEEPWRALELAATALYLQAEEALDASGAMARALSLKPACQPHRDNAESIIAKLAAERARAVA